MTYNLTITMLLIVLIPIFVVMIFIPYWTRKTESFGVSIPEDIYNDPKLQFFRKSYMWRMIILSIAYTLILLVVFLAVKMPEQTMVIVYTISVFIYLIISFFIYLSFHKQMKQLKQTEGWFLERKQQTYIHTKFRNQKLTVPHVLFIIPLTMTAILIVWTLINYEIFPDQIPMNYSLTGEVTNWADKSITTVLFLPFTQFGLTIIFIIVNIIIERAKQQISSTNPETSLHRNIIFRRRWSMFIFVSNISLVFLFSIAQISLIYNIHPTVLLLSFLIVIIGILVGSIVLSITVGQGGSRIKLPESTPTDIVNYDDDAYWKLGIFYFNKEDPTVFIEKRFGVGWSVNWARPLAWIFLIVIIGIAVGTPLLVNL